MALVITTGMAWSPKSLTGLLGWYKADAGVYTDAGTTLATNGQSVQQWNDQSGNSWHLVQATSGNRPLYNTTAFNSLPTVDFTLANAHRLATATNTFGLNSPTVSAYIVAQIHSQTDDIGRLVSFLAQGDVDDYGTLKSFCLDKQTGVTALRVEANGTGNYGQTTIAYAIDYRIGVIFDDVQDVNLYLNNVVTTTASANIWDFGGASNQGTLQLSGHAGLGTWLFDGYISEVVITSTALSSTERTNLDNYFRAKWAFGPDLTYIGTPTFDAADQTTYTFNSVNIGTASSDRLVIVAIAGEFGLTNFPLFTSGTIGGISATNVISPSVAAARYCSIMQAVVPTGTTATIVVTLSEVMARLQISVWTLTGYNSVTPVDTFQQNETTTGSSVATIDISAGGVCVAICVLNASTTQAWTNATERVDTQPDASTGISAADITSDSAQVNYAITSTHTSTESRILAASWR